LIGIDQDLDAISAAKKKLESYQENLLIIQSNFVNIRNVIEESGLSSVDGILIDLGVSSYQLDKEERGFSYHSSSDLDMRMNRENDLTAEIIVNQYSEDELTKIIKNYGEENWAKRIAKFIVEARKEKRIEKTDELVRIIKAAIPAKAREGGPHPARRTFQALRIEVNNELDVLKKVINEGIDILNKGGRMGIISFHSLEDRIVKDTFKYLEKDCICPSEFPICQCEKKSVIKIITRRPILPSNTEIVNNPRARSAKFRVAEKR
jgi:16S rRNA (cytosine1402-N4)-methyltransferase